MIERRCFQLISLQNAVSDGSVEGKIAKKVGSIPRRTQTCSLKIEYDFTLSVECASTGLIAAHALDQTIDKNGNTHYRRTETNNSEPPDKLKADDSLDWPAAPRIRELTKIISKRTNRTSRSENELN